MLGIGFGLERIGIAAARRPVIASFLLVVATVIAGLGIPQLRFDGDITAVLPEESGAYRDFFDQGERFRDFSSDVTILVQSDRLMTAEGLEAMRGLQLELSLADSVTNIVSIFSTPDPDPQTGEIGQYFPAFIENDEEASRLIDELVQRYPQMRALVSTERNTAALIVALSPSEPGEDGDSYSKFAEVRDAAMAAAPDDFTLHFAGLTPIGITIVSALLSDQVRLTLIGLALGAVIALLVYRSFVAAVVCAVPPTMTAVWSLGLLGHLGIPINYLTTVLPTLALILAFADGIVLYFRWQMNNAHGDDLTGNLEEALRRVGPASALTSVTTLLAFLSFSFASGSALKEFSLLGMAFVSLAFLAVIVALPVTCHWAARLGVVRPGKVARPVLRTIGRRFAALAFGHAATISIAAIVVVAGLTVIHFQVRPEYRITDYLPKNSDTRLAEQMANEIIGGRSMVSVAVPAAVPGQPFAPENLSRLAQVEQEALALFPEEAIVSLLRFTEQVRTPEALARLGEQFGGEASGRARSAFISRDEAALLISVRIPTDQPTAETLDQIETLRGRFGGLDFGEDVVISGFDVLMAEEFTALIDQLRTSLLIAIGLGVMIIGVATRSPMLTLAAVTPNLLPILSVELVLWLRGGSINMSEVIALTIAFGIAIDNAVHVINIYNNGLRRALAPAQALREALVEVAPALAASSCIICVSTLVTQLSVMPMLPIVGQLMIATLIVALVANLAILPANILCLTRLAARFGGQADSQDNRQAKGSERRAQRAQTERALPPDTKAEQ